jgi:hypothetical protein
MLASMSARLATKRPRLPPSENAFDPETLALLEISFNETWTELQRNGGSFDPASMRSFVADLLIEFAQQGETDPRRR